MCTIVLQKTDDNNLKYNLMNKRKKGILSVSNDDTFNKENITMDEYNKHYVNVKLRKYNDIDMFSILDKKYNLDFQYSSLSFISIYSKKSNSKIRLQLNMSYDIYSYIDGCIDILIKHNSKMKIPELKCILIKNISKKIIEWSKHIENELVGQKANSLIDEFIRYKKELIFHLKK